MCGTGGVTGGAESSTGGADSNPTSSTNTEEVIEEIEDQVKDVVQENVVEPLAEIAKPFQDAGADMLETYQDIMSLPAQQMNTITTLGQNLSKNLQTNLKRQGMFAGTSGFDQSMEDPTLAGRRRRGRRRGNEKDVRSGALKIPSSSVGVQIPA